MDEKLMVALADLLPRADKEGQWIVLYADKNEIDILSNMGLEERRQLVAKADQIWIDIIESRKKKPVDRDSFLSQLKSHQDRL